LRRTVAVQPLELAWKGVIDATLRARGWPTTDEPARLGPLVARLSAAYNDADPDAARARGGGPHLAGDLLAARLAFSFPRDVPKGAAAVREFVGTGSLERGDRTRGDPGRGAERPLRVLDLGAGLGATTWGLVRALGGVRRVEATWVDADARALELAAAVARAAPGPDGTEGARLAVRTRVASLAGEPGAVRAAWAGDGPFDVVLLGQVLSELGQPAPTAVSAAADLRVRAHAALLAELAKRDLSPGGAIVVVEPALRARTRHLHHLRAALLDAGGPLKVFAPCLHTGACPMLAKETDWCHEDLPVDLPAWLVPVARAAGLRWQGLTFSYLVLVTDDRTLVQAMPGAVRLRVVSDLIRTKGKTEAVLCGEAAASARVMRLDRDASAANAPFDDLVRGDILGFEAGALPLGASAPPSPRVRAETRVIRSRFGVDDAKAGR
jgi:SAM-dependent methyltransferase